MIKFLFIAFSVKSEETRPVMQSVRTTLASYLLPNTLNFGYYNMQKKHYEFAQSWRSGVPKLNNILKLPIAELPKHIMGF